MRLFRIGKRNQPSFKIVITDKNNPPHAGRFVEEVGSYNSLTKKKTLDKERIQYWLGQGVQPSPTVHNLLVKEGILTGKKIPKHKKAKKVKEEKPAETPKPEALKPEEKVSEVEVKEVSPQSPSEAKPSEGKEAKPSEGKEAKPSEGKEAKPSEGETPKTEEPKKE